MSKRADLVAAAQAIVDEGRFVSELAELVSCPTQSQDLDCVDEMHTYIDELLIPRLTASGFDCTVHANPYGHPFMVARRIEDPGLPTILGYGHGDVVRGQESQWSKGRKPFELRQEGDCLYGRGTADNKGQHLINMLALECVLSVRGKLGFNATILFEMGEETGSPGLLAFCEENRDLLAADVLIASDGPRMVPDIPLVFLGARGAINFELVVDLRDGAHHSGNWGGLLADPAVILANALATIVDRRGQIQIPEWHPSSLTSDIRSLLQNLPLPKGPEVDLEWGDENLTPQERVYGWNSFAILAMESGIPSEPVNAISGAARATCQLRFVTGTDVDDILPALRRHLDAAGFDKVCIERNESGFFPATRSDPDNPWVDRVVASLKRTTAVSPHLAPNLGGSLPNHVFTETLELPTIWVPHSYGGCNQHAPDEHMLIPVARQAMGLMAGLYWDIGEEFSSLKP